MKKNIIRTSLSAATALALLASCNDMYMEQFGTGTAIADVKNVTLTLSADDYAAIASNATNKALAAAKDLEAAAGDTLVGSTYANALAEVKSARCFSDLISADEFIPALLDSKYPEADLQSKFIVNYQQYVAPAEYLTSFRTIGSYTLTTADYETVWGDDIEAHFLTPSKLNSISKVLKSSVKGASAGDAVIVDYAWSETEPSLGGGNAVPVVPTPTTATWQPLDVSNWTDGSSWSFVNTGNVDLAAACGKKNVRIGVRYQVNGVSAATVEMKNFLIHNGGEEIYSATLLGADGADGFNIYDVNLTAPLPFIWQLTDTYGFKGTSYYSAVNYDAESWVVSPAIDLTDATAAQLSLDIAARYFAAGCTATDYLTVCVSTDFVEGNDGTVSFTVSGEDSNAMRSAPRRAAKLADATANASMLYYFNGSSWAPFSVDDVTTVAIDPTVYASLGTTTIASPTTVIPVYLTGKFPYAAEGDKVAVAYQGKSGAVVEEYTYAASWMPTPTSEPAVMNFLKDAEGIAANLSVYVDETFLGDQGGFTVQNVVLGEGLSYAWANTAYYGWKASAFYNSTNNDAEAWLISPTLNFKKSKEPVMTFDETHKFLNGASPLDYFAIYVSTDFGGDVTACSWTDITASVQNWATGDDWTFVNIGYIPLTEFVGKKAVTIAFRYLSNAAASPTWEIKNLRIVEASSITPAE